MFDRETSDWRRWALFISLTLTVVGLAALGITASRERADAVNAVLETVSPDLAAWERIAGHPGYPGSGRRATYRLAVFGGWVVRLNTWDEGSSVFVPDADHAWGKDR